LVDSWQNQDRRDADRATVGHAIETAETFASGVITEPAVWAVRAAQAATETAELAVDSAWAVRSLFRFSTQTHAVTAEAAAWAAGAAARAAEVVARGAEAADGGAAPPVMDAAGAAWAAAAAAGCIGWAGWSAWSDARSAIWAAKTEAVEPRPSTISPVSGDRPVVRLITREVEAEMAREKADLEAARAALRAARAGEDAA
jgi:hypothetical protein